MYKNNSSQISIRWRPYARFLKGGGGWWWLVASGGGWWSHLLGAFQTQRQFFCRSRMKRDNLSVSCTSSDVVLKGHESQFVPNPESIREKGNFLIIINYFQRMKYPHLCPFPVILELSKHSPIMLSYVFHLKAVHVTQSFVNAHQRPK